MAGPAEDRGSIPAARVGVVDLAAPDAMTLAEVAHERALAARDRAAAAQERAAAARDLGRARILLQLAGRDTLTGAMQRSLGLIELMRMVEHAHSTCASLVLAFVDVDHLKLLNDRDGHAAGDSLLSAVGAAMKKSFREGDLVVRYGGDEFLCALPDLSLTDAVDRVIEVSQVLSSTMPEATFSFGLAELEPTDSLETLIARADQAMYASRQGRLTAP